ncbi:MAG TPA: prohibitin family protein [Bryobacteraceae bacterium]|nr:prohibitin family protein [Bryobacteraceae bacterium]
MKNLKMTILSGTSDGDGGGDFMRNKITKIAAGAVPVVFGLWLIMSCYKIVAPGHVGIVVKQSGSDRGVQDFPVQSGRVWYNPVNEVVLTYPTFVQRAIWTVSTLEGRPVNDEISFQSAEGLRFTADINVSYQLTAAQVPKFYVKFRSDDLDAFTHGFFRDAVRNAFRISTAYRAEEINGVKQSELVDRILEGLRQAMQPYGVDVLQLGFATPPRPPESVKDAIESKIAATQLAERAENEKRQAIAEAAKAVEIARGQAQANDLLTRSLSPQLMQWKQLQILEQKWNGQFPQVVGSGTLPLMNMMK